MKLPHIPDFYMTYILYARGLYPPHLPTMAGPYMMKQNSFATDKNFAENLPNSHSKSSEH